QAERDLRHTLEAFHGRKDPAAVKTVWPFLSYQDRALRNAARIALEWQTVSEWRRKALKEKDPRTAIAALVALIRVSGNDKIHRKETDPPPNPDQRAKVLDALNRIAWSGLAQADRIDLLRAYSLALIRLGRPDDAERQRLIGKFDPLFPTKTTELDELLARLLIYLEAPSAAPKVVAALLAAPTQEEQVDFAVALRTLKTGWTSALRQDYFRWFVTAGSFRGGNTFESSLRRAKEDAVANLSGDEKSALKPILEAHAEHKSPREALAARPFVREWKLDELLPKVQAGLTSGRNFDRGRQLYSAVACSACHRFVNEGGSIGPDLTGVAGRFSLHDLLESIVEPSKVISDQYQAINIQLKNGDVISGRVGNLSGANINVIEDMFEPGNMTNVKRADIQSIKPSIVSPMPQGLLNSLQLDEIEDLVAYLLARGDRQNPAFR
ncbi:MAG: c-type cytochrome, partial [Limisphaerales bacterium]